MIITMRVNNGRHKTSHKGGRPQDEDYHNEGTMTDTGRSKVKLETRRHEAQNGKQA
jgi:hypothetical protein